jgi:surface antigen Omp85-like protein/calcineurin-like phosphoesterase family protein
MNIFIRLYFTIILLAIIFSINAQKSYYSPENEQWELENHIDSTTPIYTIYLIGDIKNPGQDNMNLKLLKNMISDDGENSAVIIPGDILYPLGMRDSSDSEHAEDVINMNSILNAFDDYKGRIVFIPGNHDWAKGRQQGWENLGNLETYIEEYLDRGNTFVPDNGCPGPVEIKLTDDITLIAFDSQWYFHKHDKPNSYDGCGINNENEIFIQIEDAIRRNRDKKVILASHHPLYSVGKHGGYFPPSYLLFPLLDVNKGLYIPLPGILYTGYRKYFGNIQDISHPEYKIFTESLLNILDEYPNVIYAAGHEHNLQYFNKDSLHHIISGGGGEGTYIARKNMKTDFAYQGVGFCKLSFYINGDVWMKFVTPDSIINEKVLFNKRLFNKPVFDKKKKDSLYRNINFSDSSVFVKLSDIYSVGGFQRYLMGDNYRNIWKTKVELPVFDIGSEKGGLSIIKRGGGQQTRSIRMKDKNGKQYVLRSVNKFVEKALDENMQNTIAVDVLQDGISASHPFSAVTVPILADAAEVMHTNPKFVWVPDDIRLGIYREELANGVFLFEERPAGNRDDVKSFKKSEKIINTSDVIKKTQSDHDHSIDQNSVVRARLFDILINDWDRHDDQWRWASFKENKKTNYQPIPRDRDQVYFVNEGIGMQLATKIYPLRKFQGFDHGIQDINGLTFNGRFFDRSFMAEPDLNDWTRITGEIQANVTDSVIHDAIMKMPPNIYDSTGIVIEEKLKSRRNNLDIYAKQYYNFLSKTVDVVGTNERELFEITRHENGETDVKVYALSKKKGIIKEELYHRKFNPSVTDEVRLYGLKGKDSFIITGQGSTGITVRVIGGKNNDSIIDLSRVRGISKKTIVYDRKDKNNSVITSKETRLHLSKNKSVNEYNRKQFKHNRLIPFLLVGYNIDDGISVGPGVSISRYNFRDSTFHKIKGNLAFKTGAFSLSYNGLFSGISPVFDLLMDAEISIPKNVDNYFGSGNNTKRISNNSSFYRVRYEYIWLNPRFKHTISDDFNFSFGAFYQYFKVTDTTDKYIGELYPVDLDSTAFLPHNYVGINLMSYFDNRDEELFPHRGMIWNTSLTGYYSANENGQNFVKLKSDFGFYLSFRKDPRVVFAFRFGGEANFGDYQFYHASFLGGKSNLRGFRSKRFAGDYSFYQNTEIRVKLLNISSYIFNGQTGIYVFNDIGRVWIEGENSKKWHDGYGIGIWLTPFDFAALTAAYNRSYDDEMLTFAFRFLF